ncbi:MAG: tRNA pseudouridine(13) synthase TruD [Promethearchaeota archaeon]|nr:MAG: tRNA pseudouridine(13) synthase TruD [Candidatus Lokiarchaeota archaeon]
MDENNSLILNNEKDVERFVGIEAYINSQIEGIKGIYKHIFKDFIVKEIIDDGVTLEIKEDYSTMDFSKEHKDKFTTFNLIKINKDTFEALRDLSQALKIPSELIHYSGLKDRASISVQKISIKGNYVKDLKKLKIRDIFIRHIKPTRKPVKLGGNRGNHFTITIRNIEDKKNINKRIEILANKVIKNGFLNYFGLQRFGIYRPNSHLVGRYLLENNFKEAFNEYVSRVYSTESKFLQELRGTLEQDENLKKAYKNFPKGLNYERWMINHLIEHPNDYEGCFNLLPSDLKNLLISAFQSYIFNKMISLRAEKGISLTKPVQGDAISILDDDHGQITHIKYIYGNLQGKYDKFLKRAINLNRAAIVIPIVGYDTDFNEFPLMRSLFEEIIEKEAINITIFNSELLHKFEYKGSFRAMIVKPIGFKLVKFDDDELFPGAKKLKIEFALAKGTYATMLLRELMK